MRRRVCLPLLIAALCSSCIRAGFYHVAVDVGVSASDGPTDVEVSPGDVGVSASDGPTDVEVSPGDVGVSDSHWAADGLLARDSGVHPGADLLASSDALFDNSMPADTMGTPDLAVADAVVISDSPLSIDLAADTDGGDRPGVRRWWTRRRWRSLPSRAAAPRSPQPYRT